MYIQTIPNVIVQVLIPRPELGWALPLHNWSSGRSVPAPQRGLRGPADGRLLVVYVAYNGMATQSWWRLHRVSGGGTRPRARRSSSSSLLAVGVATVCQRPAPPYSFEISRYDT